MNGLSSSYMYTLHLIGWLNVVSERSEDVHISKLGKDAQLAVRIIIVIHKRRHTHK